jgi:hypothetical protein
MITERMFSHAFSEKRLAAHLTGLRAAQYAIVPLLLAALMALG